MENILNFVQEETKKFNAEQERIQAENELYYERIKQLMDNFTAKLKPLEKLVIDGHSCKIEYQNTYQSNDIKILYGAPWKPKFETYEERNRVLIRVDFPKSDSTKDPKIDLEIPFDWHLEGKKKNVTQEEALQMVAKHFARFKTEIK